MRHAVPKASMLLLAAALGASTGCGGGGGGGGGGDPCEPPGILAPIALEGRNAPDTGGGNYGFFQPNTQLAVARGGWIVFVSDIASLSGSVAGLFVAPPSSPVRLVWRQGQAVPAPGDGTIDQFQRIFVTPTGVVVAHVTIAGGTDTFGILTARVDSAGDVVEKAGAVYSGDTLPAPAGEPSHGALSLIVVQHLHVSDAGVSYFVAAGATGTGVFRVDRTGAAFTAVAQEGQPAVGFPPGELLGDEWQALGIDQDGLLVGYAVEVVPTGFEAVYANNLTDVRLVAAADDSVPGVGGRTLEEPYEEGPLIVALASGVGVLVWEGRLSGLEPNDVILHRRVSPALEPLTVMAAGGQIAPGAGSAATLDALRLLDPEVDALAAVLRASIVGGSTSEIFYSLPGPGTLLEMWRAGADAPGTGPGAFTTTYPSLAVPFRTDADVESSTALTAVLSDATTGLFWALRDCGFFLLARPGNSIPGVGGGSFGSFAGPSSVATASGIVAFHAQVTGVPGTVSGIFAQR
jgi:hypothetical protein